MSIQNMDIKTSASITWRDFTQNYKLIKQKRNIFNTASIMELELYLPELNHTTIFTRDTAQQVNHQIMM